MQIVTTVDKNAVLIENQRMYAYLNEANRVNARTAYRDLQDNIRALNICKGMYQVLDNLGLTEEKNFVGEDIKRIEAKISSILEEKHRRELLRRKGGNT